jgi:lauroyl/myristoyl acyltransferase
MDAASTSSVQTPLEASAPRTPAWLGPFFALAAAAPNLARALRPLACRLMPACSRRVRESTALNARRIFGKELSNADARRYARAVAGSFFDFVTDVALEETPEEARRDIRRVEGLEGYRAARAARRGAVLVTAHLGSFERGLAALAGAEPRIRVVFRRDTSGHFRAAAGATAGAAGGARSAHR